MGQICSVSLPAGKTCRNAPCFEKCYARKIERLRKTVRDAYQHNYEVLGELGYSPEEVDRLMAEMKKK